MHLFIHHFTCIVVDVVALTRYPSVPYTPHGTILHTYTLRPHTLMKWVVAARSITLYFARGNRMQVATKLGVATCRCSPRSEPSVGVLARA